MTATEHPRSIRSFVTRGGRITAAQERALSCLWPKYGVAFGTQVLDTQALFGRDAPCTIEIGFGNGENLLSLACAHPGRDFLGVEVHRPGVGRLLLGLDRKSTRLNSSHRCTSYAVFCLKKKTSENTSYANDSTAARHRTPACEESRGLQSTLPVRSS